MSVVPLLKKVFFLFYLHKNKYDFFLFFRIYKTDLNFFTYKLKITFFFFFFFLTLLQNISDVLYKTFFFLILSKQKHIWFLFNESNQFSLFSKIDLNFSKIRGYIHKINLFELMLVMCLSCMFNISFIPCKNGYIGH